jgi:hypothetical protein
MNIFRKTEMRVVNIYGGNEGRGRTAATTATISATTSAMGGEGWSLQTPLAQQGLGRNASSRRHVILILTPIVLWCLAFLYSSHRRFSTFSRVLSTAATDDVSLLPVYCRQLSDLPQVYSLSTISN